MYVCMESGGLWLCFLEGTGFKPRADSMRMHPPQQATSQFFNWGLGFSGPVKETERLCLLFSKATFYG